MNKKPPVSFYLWRRAEASGLYPLKLRVTFTRYVGDQKKWDQKYYPTGLSFTESEYQKITTGKNRTSHPDYKKMLDLEKKASDIIDTNPYISPDLFGALGKPQLNVQLSLK